MEHGLFAALAQGGWLITLVPALMWLGLLLLPGRPWGIAEQLEADPQRAAHTDLSSITVLTPARNEADTLGQTLTALQQQGQGLQIVVVDDQSEDGTAQIAASFPNTRVIQGQSLPEGWAGKLWALEQGKNHISTPTLLLIDADIQLQPGLLAALLALKQREGRHFVSLMADLRRTSFWDRLLLPAFVYYFKLLYPFSWSNSRHPWVAGAAGGCILVDTEVLHKIGAFASLKGALIDDCTLARQVKNAGFRTWLGLSRGVISLRPYGSLGSIHDMVARSAFTQLRYSTPLLWGVTGLFFLAYAGPFLAWTIPGGWPWGLLAWLCMTLSYLPILRYYQLSLCWALLLPFSAAFYLGMTWSSAVRYWRGVRSRWKGRVYNTH